MPRIYADNEAHSIDWGAIAFLNGVGAVPYGADTSYFAAMSYAIDTSKHAATLFDKLSSAQLKEICDFMAVSYEEDVTKQELVRAIEGFISTANLAAVTVASAAGATVGKTAITITGAGTYKYKIADAALTPLYKDDVSDWTAIVTGAEFTTTAGKYITVAKVNSDGLVLGVGSAEIVVKTS